MPIFEKKKWLLDPEGFTGKFYQTLRGNKQTKATTFQRILRKKRGHFPPTHSIRLVSF